MFSLNEKIACEFLAKNNFHNCKITKIAGDASFRSYYRIVCDDKTHILMFAPPSHEDIKPFEKIADFLIQNNFSAPKIFARSEEEGFLLLEDLDDDTYGRILAKISGKELQLRELELYHLACDCLTELHKIPAPKDIVPYNNALLFREVMLFVDWYLPLQKKTMSLEQKKEFKFLWFKIFDLLDKENQVLVLRDYHADNLMFLPQRKNHQKVGLLDFQDAVIGSKAYDLVSLLEDARRDLNEENRELLFNHYLKNLNSSKEIFIRDYEILSLQRNLKILGIFARLSIRDNKHHYLNLLPRVLNFVKMRVATRSDALLDISNFLKNFI